MSEFIGYTVGLRALHKYFNTTKLVKAELNRVGEKVKISAASGKYGNAAASGNNGIEEARWAFKKKLDLAFNNQPPRDWDSLYQQDPIKIRQPCGYSLINQQIKG